MAFGTVLLVAWLWAAAYNAECYAGITSFLGSIIGRIMLVGWTFAFYFHLGNGIRHLFWDVGIGFSLPALHRSGWTVVIFSIIFTAVTWWCIMTRAAA